jgi:hypothetical protein
VCTLIALSAFAAVFAALNSDIFRSSEYLVWKPLLDPSEPLTLCIPDNNSLEKTGETVNNTPWQAMAGQIDTRTVPSPANLADSASIAPIINANAAHKITAWLAEHDREASLRSSSAINFQNFHQRPMVLIGGYNPWSLFLLTNLRFSIRIDPATHDRWIQDAQNPSQRNWNRDGKVVHTDVDYAIITRIFDADTGGWILALGGLWPYGTDAACDLLTHRMFAHSFPTALRSKSNYQIVLKTHVINNTAGTPQIIAVHSW